MSSLPDPSNSSSIASNSVEVFGDTSIGFKTASGKEVKISAAAMRKAQTLMMSVEKEEIPSFLDDVESLPVDEEGHNTSKELITDEDDADDWEPTIDDSEPVDSKQDEEKEDDENSISHPTPIVNPVQKRFIFTSTSPVVPIKKFKSPVPASLSQNIGSSAVAPVQKRLGSSRIMSSFRSQTPSFKKFKPPTRVVVTNTSNKVKSASSVSDSKNSVNVDFVLEKEINDAVAACMDDGDDF